MKLIDKDALLAEIESLLDKGKYHEEYDCAYRDGNNSALYALKEKIDTLEVKEVDLDKEIDNFWDKNYRKVECGVKDIKLIGEHFFELGIKAAQKGE